MVQLSEMQMYEFLSGGMFATVYHFYKKGVKIIGFASGNSFKIKVLSIGHNTPRKGFGQAALKFLRPRYKKNFCNRNTQGGPAFLDQNEGAGFGGPPGVSKRG